MNLKKTVLIIPPNDAEAVMICKLAQKLGLPVIESKQHHGASMDKGHDYAKEVKKGGYTQVIIVEMPGPKTEAVLRKRGLKVEIIDHHHYTGLSRAHDKKGKLLPSSLEQFLKKFRITDARLIAWGFVPALVRGIGIQDRGYVWALQEEGYSKKEIKDVMAFHDQLIAHLQDPKKEQHKKHLAQRAWERRKKWGEFWIVSTKANMQLRPALSRIIVEQVGKPVSLIILEYGRGLVYVQESPYALHLFERFGGFTFGLDRNWGHRNEPGQKILLKDIQKLIEMIRHAGETV